VSTKAQIVELLNRGDGTLGKAADDEPVFILRAKDRLAPGTVEAWAGRLQELAEDSPKAAEALQLAAEMRRWQSKNGAKTPD